MPARLYRYIDPKKELRLSSVTLADNGAASNASVDTVNQATEVRLLAERQMGAFLKEMPKAKAVSLSLIKTGCGELCNRRRRYHNARA